jgi:hypothetical protein
MNNYDHGHNGMSTFWAMFLGMTVGAVGTAVLLAMNERRFHYVVEESRNMGKRLRERMDEGMDVARGAASDAMDSVERVAQKSRSSLRDNANM